MSEAHRESMCKMLPSVFSIRVFVSIHSSHRRTFAQVSMLKCPPQYDDIKIITSALTPPCRDATTLCLLHAISSVVSFRFTQNRKIRAFSQMQKRAKSVLLSDYSPIHWKYIFASFLQHNFADESFCTRASACNVFNRGGFTILSSGVYSTHRRREMHCYCCFSINETHPQIHRKSCETRFSCVAG